LEAAGGILPLCLLLAALPFLAVFDPGDLALPEAFETMASTGSRESSSESPDGRPVDRGQDECHSVPGGNPAGRTASPALLPRTGSRKGGGPDDLAGAAGGPGGAELRSRTCLSPVRAAGLLATFRPPLAFFPGYPVFLLGDLPPPAA
jgi:hypothetical protein